MKKILIQLDSDRVPSVFDAVTAYDSGIDALLQYSGVVPNEVRDLVYGAMFTRGPSDLKNTAVFIGGANVSKGEALLREAMAAFFNPLRVSVMLDANGCNTTATAAVIKVISAVPVQGRRVVVLAGTGPVGQRAAALLFKEGAEVILTSRTLERAKAACDAIQERFGAIAAPAEVDGIPATAAILEQSVAAICTGVEGVMLVPESLWKDHSTLCVLADVNAVPPLGLGGTQSHWDGHEVNGKKLFGAIGIGGLKMKIHKKCIAGLFERNDLVLDAEEIMRIAKQLI